MASTTSFNRSFRNSQFGPQPDSMPVGMERLAIHEAPQKLAETTVTVVDVSPSVQPVTQRAKPEIRLKNKHLEEIYRLKQQLSELQEDNGHIQDAMGKMVVDLDEAQSNLNLKELELKKKDEELMTLQKNVNMLLTELNQERKDKAQVEERFTQQEKVIESQLVGNQGRIDPISRHEPTVPAAANKEVNRLQAEVMRLSLLVQAKETELSNRDFAAAQNEKRWDAHVQKQTTQFEKQLVQQKEFAREEFRKQEKLLEDAKVALADQNSRSSSALEVEDLRRRSNFYQKNSERLSTQIKSSEANNRQLQDSVREKAHEIHVLESLLKSQGYS
jgi:hypothetical protein